MANEVLLTGLDGANPLAFLAALGALRLADQWQGGQAKLGWRRQGRWESVLRLPDGTTKEQLVPEMYQRLHRVPDKGAVILEQGLRRKMDAAKKLYASARKELQKRKLRGEERLRAEKEELLPLRQAAEAARTEWLAALARAVPAFYLNLGKALSVKPGEFVEFAQSIQDRLEGEGLPVRQDADFAAAFGCEACLADWKIEPTPFQLITGSGHQFFLETIGLLMAEVTEQKLTRALFGPWTFADRKLSFRWGPDEDRRYAYGWADPSDGKGVPSEHGANLLAAMGLPLFPSVPVRGRLQTTGFCKFEGREWFTWPIWEPCLGVDAVRSLLALRELREASPDRLQLARRGVEEVYRSERIEVGTPPLSKLNLTPAVAV